MKAIYDTRFTCSLTRSMHDSVRKAAEKDGTTLAEWTRRVIAAALNVKGQ